MKDIKRKEINTFGIVGRSTHVFKSTAKLLIPFATKSELAIEYCEGYDDKLCRMYEFNTGTLKFWICHTYANRLYYDDIEKDTMHKSPMLTVTDYPGDTYRFFKKYPFVRPGTKELQKAKREFPIGTKVVLTEEAKKAYRDEVDEDPEVFGVGEVRNVYQGMTLVEGRNDEIFMFVYFPDFPRLAGGTKSPVAFFDDCPINYVEKV